MSVCLLFIQRQSFGLHLCPFLFFCPLLLLPYPLSLAFVSNSQFFVSLGQINLLCTKNLVCKEGMVPKLIPILSRGTIGRWNFCKEDRLGVWAHSNHWCNSLLDNVFYATLSPGWGSSIPCGCCDGGYASIISIIFLGTSCVCFTHSDLKFMGSFQLGWTTMMKTQLFLHIITFVSVPLMW